MIDAHEVEIKVFVHGETAKAWQISETGDIRLAMWLPKSQAVDGGDATVGAVCEFLVPEWLASLKGLI